MSISRAIVHVQEHLKRKMASNGLAIAALQKESLVDGYCKELLGFV
jgi:hypothetical protein